jgi:hypothetical protein
MSFLAPIAGVDLPSLYPVGTRSTDGLFVVSAVYSSSGSLQNAWISAIPSATGGTGGTPLIRNPVTGAVLSADTAGVITLPNQDEVLIGSGAPTGAPPAGKEIYLDVSSGRYYINNSGAWSAGFGGAGALKTRITAPLVVGNNAITHNFALTAPFASIVSVRDAATGNLIDHTINSEAANSLNVNVGIAVASAIITVIS